MDFHFDIPFKKCSLLSTSDFLFIQLQDIQFISQGLCLILCGFHFSFIIFCLVWFGFFCLFAFARAAPEACGYSQARGLIGAVAAGLHQSHSNSESEPRLQPTPQLTAMLDPQPTEQGQGSNPQPHGP